MYYTYHINLIRLDTYAIYVYADPLRHCSLCATIDVTALNGCPFDFQHLMSSAFRGRLLMMA